MRQVQQVRRAAAPSFSISAFGISPSFFISSALGASAGLGGISSREPEPVQRPEPVQEPVQPPGAGAGAGAGFFLFAAGGNSSGHQGGQEERLLHVISFADWG